MSELISDRANFVITADNAERKVDDIIDRASIRGSIDYNGPANERIDPCFAFFRSTRFHACHQSEFPSVALLLGKRVTCHALIGNERIVACPAFIRLEFEFGEWKWVWKMETR